MWCLVCLLTLWVGCGVLDVVWLMVCIITLCVLRLGACVAGKNVCSLVFVNDCSLVLVGACVAGKNVCSLVFLDRGRLIDYPRGSAPGLGFRFRL